MIKPPLITFIALPQMIRSEKGTVTMKATKRFLCIIISAVMLLSQPFSVLAKGETREADVPSAAESETLRYFTIVLDDAAGGDEVYICIIPHPALKYG